MHEKNEGIWWWKYLQEEYSKQHGEVLDPDWVKQANDEGFAAGISFQENQRDWLLSLIPVNLFKIYATILF